MSNPDTYDFEGVRGDYWDDVFQYRDSENAVVDVSTWTLRCVFKSSADGTTYMRLSSTLATPTITGNSTGDITFAAPSTDTASLDFVTARYDIEIDSGGKPKTIVKGKCTLYKDMTT